MTRLFASTRALLTAAAASIAFTVAQAAPCSPSGLYLRSHGDQIQVEAVSEEPGGPSKASFSLLILGRMVLDAPSVGQAQGEILLTPDHCVGVYSEPGICTLVFSFSTKHVRVHQIDHCMFGAGAYGSGIYVKTTKPSRYRPSR
jgi:hypothetical protein